MTKQIKFRVWDTKQNLMFNSKTTSFFIGSDGRKYIQYFKNHKQKYPMLCTVGKEFIFQQFTGLKDKNGKEIYEGDIVKFWPDSLSKKFITGEVEQNEWWTGFSLNSKEDGMEDYILSTFDKFEIIGNIFEHPNLLKL